MTTELTQPHVVGKIWFNPTHRFVTIFNLLPTYVMSLLRLIQTANLPLVLVNAHCELNQNGLIV